MCAVPCSAKWAFPQHCTGWTIGYQCGSAGGIGAGPGNAIVDFKRVREKKGRRWTNGQCAFHLQRLLFLLSCLQHRHLRYRYDHYWKTMLTYISHCVFTLLCMLAGSISTSSGCSTGTRCTTPYFVGAQGRICQLTCINYSAQFFNPPTSVETLV